MVYWGRNQTPTRVLWLFSKVEVLTDPRWAGTVGGGKCPSSWGRTALQQGPDPGAPSESYLARLGYFCTCCFLGFRVHRQDWGRKKCVSNVGSGAPLFGWLLHCLCYLNVRLWKCADRKPVTQKLAQQRIEFHILRWAPVRRLLCIFQFGELQLSFAFSGKNILRTSKRTKGLRK